MSLWNSLRREVGGTVRSIGYDLRQRFRGAGSSADASYPEYDAYARRPRRVLIGGGIAVLAAGGVAGTYLLLAGGLGGWLLGSNPSAPDPAARPGTPAVTTGAQTPRSQPTKSLIPSTAPLPGSSVGHPTPGLHPTPSTLSGSHRATSPPVVKPSHSPTKAPASPTPSPAPSPTPSESPTSGDSPSPSSPSPSDNDSPSGARRGRAHDAAAQAPPRWSLSTLRPTGA